MKRVVFFTHELSDALYKALLSQNIEIVAVVQGTHPDIPSFSLFDMFEGGGDLQQFPTQQTPFKWLDDAAFRVYARCIARLGFVPGSKSYDTICGGIVQVSDLEEWARSHMNFALQLLNGVNADEVWFGVLPHLGIDNILQQVALKSGRTVLTFRQVPLALKFFYFVEKLDSQLVAPIKSKPSLAWEPWQAGVVAPNLFYMQENVGRKWSSGLTERLYYLAKNIAKLNGPQIMERAYLAARKRRWTNFMLILEHLSFRVRPIAFTRWYLRKRFSSIQKKLEKNQNISNQPMNSAPYVYFALHLEPELNTQILGDAYYNQLDALTDLHKVLPAGWKIRIKENPKQSYLHRGEVYYKRLGSLLNIEYVDANASSSNLIKHAAVTATITGTAGFEAAIAGKSCVYFGLPWYAGLPGTFKFDAKIDLQAIAAHSSSKSMLDEGMNKILSALADGLIFPRYGEIFENTHDMQAVAQTTAASLARISGASE